VADPLDPLWTALANGAPPPFEWAVAYGAPAAFRAAWNASVSSTTLIGVARYLCDRRTVTRALCACVRAGKVFRALGATPRTRQLRAAFALVVADVAERGPRPAPGAVYDACQALRSRRAGCPAEFHALAALDALGAWCLGDETAGFVLRDICHQRSQRLRSSGRAGQMYDAMDARLARVVRKVIPAPALPAFARSA